MNVSAVQLPLTNMINDNLSIVCVRIVGSFGNDSQDILLKGANDIEAGAGSESRAEKVGPYQFIWTNGEDFYNGCGADGADATADFSTSKVGRKYGG